MGPFYAWGPGGPNRSHTQVKAGLDLSHALSSAKCFWYQGILFYSPYCTILMQKKKKKKKAKTKPKPWVAFFLLQIYLTFTFHVPLTISCTPAHPDFILFSKMDFLLSCLKHPNDLCFGLFLNHHMLGNCAQRNYFQSGLNTQEKHTANFFSRAVQTFP